MYKLHEIYEVKRLKLHEHLSNREIGRRLDIDPRTVASLLKRSEQADNVWPKRKSPHNDSAGKQFIPFITNILEASRSNTNKKNRITAAAIYQMLELADPPFLGLPPVSKRTIERVVSQVRKELGMFETHDAFIKQVHDKGSAQVDFGEMDVIMDRKTSRISLLIMTFPYSNRKFACALPAQNFECLAEGIRWICNAAGGVPRVIRFDNLSPAVSQVKVPEDSPYAAKDANGKLRKLTVDFTRLIAHYGFKFEFCNIRAGYEKGSVEQAVNWYRTRFFAITREFDRDYLKLNNELLQFSEKAAQKPHYKFQHETVAERFEREKAVLLPLPKEEFDGAVWVTRRVNKYGEVKLNSNTFQVSGEYPATIDIRCTWDSLEFFKDGKSLKKIDRPYEQGKEFIDWEIELSSLIKKPTAFKSSILAKTIPPEVVPFILKHLADDKRRIFSAMRDLLKDNKIEPVMERLSKCVALYADEPLTDFICRFYAYGEDRVDDRPKLSELEPMARLTEQVNLNQYDKLTE